MENLRIHIYHGEKWEKRFLAMSQLVASWSKDPSTKVGSVIVDRNRLVVGVGYNGFPRGIKDTKERLEDRPTKYSLIVHAEANAILNASASVQDCVLYSVQIPCHECCKLIIQAGIGGVVALQTPEMRWEESKPFLEEAGLRFGIMSLE